MAPKRHASNAGDHAQSPAKVAKRAKAELHDKVQSVTEVLTMESLMPGSVPKKVLEMLALGAPHALSTTTEERHQLHSTVLGYIQEVFDEASTMFRVRLTEAQAAADAKSAEIEAATAKVAATASEIEKAEQAVTEQKGRLAEKEEAVKSAEKDAKAADANMRANAKENAAHTKQREGLKAIEDAGLNALVEGSLSEKEAKKVSAKFIKDLEKLGADQSLLASAPAVLLKSKDQRQGFDHMVIDSLRAMLADRISAVDASIAANVTACQELETAAAAQAAAVESSRQACEAEAESLRKMQGDLAALKEAKKAQQAEVEALRAAHAEKVGGVADVQEEAQCLHDAKSTFESLVSRSSAPEPEEQPAGETPAPAAVTA
mmetsp:Transcript_35575/g.70714  ORF Transcript_35575/g.70714 Transcript_35575/m.70714 type:complete len:376 (+) Transcript_35575:105-1232(+)